MLMVLINIVIVIVVGAILFYLIDKYVRDGRLGNLLRDPGRADLPCGDPAAVASDAGGGRALAFTGTHRFGACQEPVKPARMHSRCRY